MAKVKINKYTYGDLVRFRIDNNRIMEGTIEIVDRYGALDCPGGPCYGIFIKENNLLVKHVPEYLVIEKLGKAPAQVRLYEPH